MNIAFRVDRIEKGERSYHFENPTLGDLLWLLFNMNKRHKTDDQAYGSGFFGWHKMYWNVNDSDNLLFSPGLSFGDYIYASRREGTYYDPAGYFFHIGPAFKTSYVINEQFWVDGFINYDIGFKVGKISGQYVKSAETKRPHFLNLEARLNHAPSRVFTSFRMNQLIDRGEHKDNASRIDFSLGFIF